MAYEIPTPADLIVTYPAFAAVPSATIAKHIANADATGADASWNDADRTAAVIALAAHNMAGFGIGDHGQVAEYARQGLTSIRSGSFSADFAGDVAKANAAGSLDATPFGREYKRLLAANRGGPRVVGAGLGGGASGQLSRQNNGLIAWPGY